MVKLKYYYEFRSLKNDLYRVEIYENTEATITAVDVEKSFMGLGLEYKELDSKFDTVIGSGVTFDLLAKTTFQFLDLYTGDIKKYQVRCYKNGATLWVGWLNTEYYQEDWARSKNMAIDLTASDFTILERIQYLDATQQPYEGIASLYSILTTCLAKLELPYRYLYINCSIAPSNIALAAGETVLHVEHVKNRNFYDEDYKAMDCMAVVDKVLKTFLLTIKQVDGDLYVYDVEAIAKGTPFKKYDAQTFAYIGSEAVATHAGQIETIGYKGNESTFSIIPSYNRAKLTFSAFKQCEIAEASIDKYSVSTLIREDTVTDVRSGVDFSFKVGQYDNTKGLTLGNPKSLNNYGYATVLTPTGEFIKNEDCISGVMLYNRPAAVQHQRLLSFTAKLPVLINETGDYALKVEAKVLTIRTDNYFADGDKVDKNINPCVQVQVPFVLYFPTREESGRLYYKAYNNTAIVDGTGSDKWEDGYTQLDWMPYTESIMQFCDWGATTSIDNRWTSCKHVIAPRIDGVPLATPETTDFTIPLPAGSYGELRFAIINGTNPRPMYQPGNITPKMILLNDLKLSLVDKKGKSIELTDVEYTSYINKQFKDDADDIEQVIGTNVQSFPNENGSLLQWDAVNKKYYFARTFTKAGETAEIEKLALRTIISNYKNKTAGLSVTLKSGFKPLGYITTKHIAGSKLMISGYKLDCLNDSVEVVGAEIFEDNLSINSIEYEPN